MACCTPKRRVISLVVVGFLVLAIGCVCIPLFKWIIKQQIIKNVILVEGSQTYANFLEPSPEIYMQYYVFHVNNPEEVKLGKKKPSVTQKGPYTYREYRKKINVVHNQNGTVTYEQRKTFHFVREKSVGSDEDTFITLNLVLLTVANAMRNEPNLVKIATQMLMQKEDLFINKTIREIVWGYHDPLLNLSSMLAPSWFTTDLVGTMAGKNDTTDGIYTVFTGETNTTLLGVVDKYNGSRELPYWFSKEANTIVGTDGTLCHPFVTTDDVLYSFSTEICRSVPGVYSGHVTSPQGIKLWRFSGTPEVFASGYTYPSNMGFCVPKGHCIPSGLLDISVCQFEDGFPLPVYISQPHFYQGNQSLVDAVDGMHPNATEHRTEIDIQPDTGLVMKAIKRLQINTYLEPHEIFSNLENVKPVYFPILYADENFVVDDKDANKFKSSVQVPMMVTRIVPFVLIALAGVLLIIALGYGLCVFNFKAKTNSGQVEETVVNRNLDEQTPLLRDAAEP